MEEFPTVPGFDFQTDTKLKPFILPKTTAEDLAKALKKAGRASPPILAYAALDVADTNANNYARFALTNLETVQDIRGRKIDAQFPNVDQVWPKEDPKETVTMNAQLLSRVLKAFSEFGSGNPENPIRIEFRGKHEPIRLVRTDPDLGEIEAIIMPLRVPGTDRS